ncbi:MAG: hypothetical protein HC848_04570 [Limnobacter sp.]|nr:hypothetical protein [Limnobacter sp.]
MSVISASPSVLSNGFNFDYVARTEARLEAQAIELDDGVGLPMYNERIKKEDWHLRARLMEEEARARIEKLSKVGKRQQSFGDQQDKNEQDKDKQKPEPLPQPTAARRIAPKALLRNMLLKKKLPKTQAN